MLPDCVTSRICYGLRSSSCLFCNKAFKFTNYKIVSFTISTTFVAVHGMSAEAIYLVYIHSQELLDEDDVP
jgi:hypothetical protein